MITTSVSVPRTRCGQPGSTLKVLMLATGPDHCAGVDLDSGAFVRGCWPAEAGSAPTFRSYVVATGVIADDDAPPDPAQPERVALTGPPRPTGRLRRRLVERYLRPLLAPEGLPLLGFFGPSIPYWDVPGTHPSLALMVPSRGPQVIMTEEGRLRARFEWDDMEHLYPVTDPRTSALIKTSGRYRLSADALAGVLGHHVRYLLMALSPPAAGHCYKTLIALLPPP